LAIEEAIERVRPGAAYFWVTHTGAELDLLLRKGGRRYGVEASSRTPRVSPSRPNGMGETPGKNEMMKRERLTRMERIFVEGTLVDRAVEAAARDALALHKQAGVPVVVCRGWKVVTVSAGALLGARSAARRRFRAVRATGKGVGA
jgi:hypothetical protein